MKIDLEDIKALKYYLIFCLILILIYIYSMIVGWRFLSFNESSHSRERTNTHYHK